MRRTGRITAVLNRPTLFAQLSTATSSLLLVAILTRGLPVEDFGRYSALLAVVAFGNALIGSTIATRAIESAVRRGESRLTVVAGRDGIGLLLAGGCAAAFAWSLGATVGVMVASCAAMFGFLLAELAGAHLLGLRRFWTFAAVTVARATVWVAAVGLGFAVGPDDARMEIALFAIFLSGLVPIATLAGHRLVRVEIRASGRSPIPISWIGICNLALWILASGDRVVLSYSALSGLAGYVALYGILDRVFRTFITAYSQRFLPDAFAQGGVGTRSWDWRTVARIAVVGALLLAGGTLLSPPLVSAISGGQYVPQTWMALVLTGAMLAMAGAMPAYVRLVGAGRGRDLALLALAVAAANVAGNIALAPTYGATSAAVLSLMGYLGWCGGAWWLWRRTATLPDHADESARQSSAKRRHAGGGHRTPTGRSGSLGHPQEGRSASRQ